MAAIKSKSARYAGIAVDNGEVKPTAAFYRKPFAYTSEAPKKTEVKDKSKGEYIDPRAIKEETFREHERRKRMRDLSALADADRNTAE